VPVARSIAAAAVAAVAFVGMTMVAIPARAQQPMTLQQAVELAQRQGLQA
jgi:hypothetical protein